MKEEQEGMTMNIYSYTDRELDSEDLYYYRARYYDPSMQMFISKDPIEFEAGDFNFYRYVGNDPVNYVDPTGLLTAVITNGRTTTLTSVGNPFGHSALATSGSGVYSYGNSTDLGSSLTEYLKREAPKRDTYIQIFNTTPEEEKKIQEYFDKYPDRNGVEAWPDNCASRTSEALKEGGIQTLNTGFPYDLANQLNFFHNPVATIKIPQDSKIIPDWLNIFNSK